MKIAVVKRNVLRLQMISITFLVRRQDYPALHKWLDEFVPGWYYARWKTFEPIEDQMRYRRGMEAGGRPALAPQYKDRLLLGGVNDLIVPSEGDAFWVKQHWEANKGKYHLDKVLEILAEIAPEYESDILTRAKQYSHGAEIARGRDKHNRPFDPTNMNQF